MRELSVALPLYGYGNRMESLGKGAFSTKIEIEDKGAFMLERLELQGA